MAVQNQYLATGGDLGEATRRRSGSSLSIASDVPMPGNPGRAARISAQAAQPVTGPRGPIVGGIADGLPDQTAGRSSGGSGGGPVQTTSPGMLDGLAGGAKAVAGAVALPFAVGVDALRSGAARAVGGDPNTLPGGSSKYADAASATLDQGLSQAQSAGEDLRAGARAGLGVRPRTAVADEANPLTTLPATAPAAAVREQAPRPAASPAASGQDYMRVGIGGSLPGGEIAMRLNADGAYEFTNDQELVRSAGAVPQGGAGRIGDGRGTFSQAEAGSSQLAIDRFERANQERGRMVAESQRGELGNNGGRLTVVRDSSRTPTLQERLLARQDRMLAETEAVRANTQEGILAGLDTRQNSQVQRQKGQQDIASGAMELQSAQQLQRLRNQLADPSLSAEDREIARDTYTSLSTQAKDRFKSQDVILGRDENGRDIRGTQLIDVTTGRPVAGIGDNLPVPGAVPAVGTRKGGYEFLGGDPSDQKNWRKV